MHNKITAFDHRLRQIFNFIIKYRYLIALIVFIILVVLKVNGSSMGYWSNYVGDSAKSTIVAGKYRPIRSDEWEVLTPNYLSQTKSNTAFSVINKNMAVSGQNMLLSLGAPVKDIYTLSKPLNWGYLLLGGEYGTSWYWNLKLLLILLLSFELCMIITKGNRLVSVLGAFWLAFSPAVQWWFAQHVGDILLYMEAIIVSFFYFVKYFNGKIWRKIVFAFLFALSCLGYVFPLYPPLQVPFGFLAIIIMAVVLISSWKKLKFRIWDIFIVVGTAAFILLVLLHVYLISKDAIFALSNTVYPGKRTLSGGGAQDFFAYSFLTNPFLPYTDTTIMNNCEVSSFINFLPAVILALPILIRKKTGNLRFGIALAAFSSFFLCYMYFTIPTFLAKITLLSYVTNMRAILAYALAGTLASIWALSEISKAKCINRYVSAIISIMIGISYVVCVKFTQLHGYVLFRYYFAFILVLVVLNYLLLRGRARSFAVIMFCVVMVSGATVNPVNIGVGAIYNNDLSKEIQSIDQKDPDAVWMSAIKNDPTGALGAFLYANGAKSLGGVNSIPDKKKWSAIDPTGKYNAVYDRSAHITFNIVTQTTSFTLTFLDSFTVNINVGDIKKLNTKYIVSDKDLSKYNDATITFTQDYPRTAQGYAIYTVSYH